MFLVEYRESCSEAQRQQTMFKKGTCIGLFKHNQQRTFCGGFSRLSYFKQHSHGNSTYVMHCFALVSYKHTYAPAINLWLRLLIRQCVTLILLEKHVKMTNDKH